MCKLRPQNLFSHINCQLAYLIFEFRNRSHLILMYLCSGSLQNFPSFGRCGFFGLSNHSVTHGATFFNNRLSLGPRFFNELIIASAHRFYLCLGCFRSFKGRINRFLSLMNRL
ncbi:MAG: hypothetical protein RL157_276 [Bacteroidota bacterium]